MTRFSPLTITDVYKLRDYFVKEYLGIEFYAYQTKVSNIIIKHTLLRTGDEIPIEISRQAGKTEAVVCTVAFLMTFARSLTLRFWGYSAGIRFIVWAPQKEQAKTDFDRLKLYLARVGQSPDFNELVDKAESNQTTLQIKDGSFCYIFPLTQTSNPESKTADVQIFEEAHKIIDSEKKNKAEPMGAATNAPEISIGVAWYVKNYFKVMIDKYPKHPHFPADDVIKARRKKYEQDKNPRHLLYERNFKKRVERYGRDDPAIQTQWLLKWMLEGGQFMTAEDWEEMTEKYVIVREAKKLEFEAQLLDGDKENDCYAGIDTAKHPDSTVVTIVRWNRKTGWKELVALLELHGTNYADQFTIISGFDTNAGKMTGRGMFEFFNVRAVAIDSTGQGDFMPDMFENHTRWKDEKTGLFRIKFSLPGKDSIYTNLRQVMLNRLTAIPKEDTLELRRLREQLLQLEMEWKGQFLVCHHPEDDQGQEYHDDYPDSWALAEWAFAKRQQIAEPKVRTL